MSHRPGTLCRFTCCACGTVELVKGGTNGFLCSSCKPTRRRIRQAMCVGRYDAGAAVAAAIANGELPHPCGMACVDCGKPASEYEHRDYNKPLAVEPVCVPCNRARGPAIPHFGAVQTMLQHGGIPYKGRARASKVLRLLGRPDLCEGLPSKLDNAIWRDLWSRLTASQQAAA